LYIGWDESDFISPYFSRVSFEKVFFGLTLFGLDSFEVRSYVQNSDNVWVFVEGGNSVNDEDIFLLLVYDKKAKGFEMLTAKSEEGKVVTNVLRHDLMVSGLFKEEKHASDEVVFVGNNYVDKNKNEDGGYFWLMIFVFFVSVFIVLMYLKIKSK
jgi:hypothetical protein